MAICIICSEYFKPSKTNAYDKSTCESCLDVIPTEHDPEVELEATLLINKSGKTRPVFYDDRDEM